MLELSFAVGLLIGLISGNVISKAQSTNLHCKEIMEDVIKRPTDSDLQRKYNVKCN